MWVMHSDKSLRLISPIPKRLTLVSRITKKAPVSSWADEKNDNSSCSFTQGSFLKFDQDTQEGNLLSL